MSSLSKLQTLLRDSGLGALLVTDITNVQWLTGFTGSSAVVIATPDRAVFITDSRYTIQAGVEVSVMPVISFASPRSLDEVIAEESAKFGLQSIAFETSQTYAAVQARRTKLSDFNWVESTDLFKELRMIKSEQEVAMIQDACKLADECLNHVTRLLQVGVSEFDICLDIEFFYRRSGAELGFAPIVVSGPNSAKPHGMPGERKLERGDFVTIDCGCKLNGYNSDITRTFVIGEASDRHVEVYEQVLRANVECIQALRPGTTGKAVDALARDILEEKKLAQYFGHGLGHGLGRVVHDPGSLSQRSEDDIKSGQVWTIEPGVYIDGFGGVRIEDDVLVTSGEPKILTHFPKHLTVLA